MNQTTVAKSSKGQKPRLISTSDLPLSCPTKEDQTWNLHPKVFLQFNETGEASCQYCGAQYKLES
ncbi:MAG: zinc-finger domain-containing protein [Marinicellaceae bacterium]